MSETPTIVPVGDVHTAILGAPPLPMRPIEIVWTRTAALRDASTIHLSEAQQKIVCEGVLKYNHAVRYHVKLTTESGEPAGSGVCVTSGGRRGILTARHVLFADDEGKKRLPHPVVMFMPPRDYMLRVLSSRDNLIDSEGPFLAMPMTGISIGDRETIVPLQRPGKTCPDPGLPDFAIVAVSDDIEERLREAAAEAGTIAAEPEWLDLDTEDQVGIRHSMTNEDEMLMGDWIVMVTIYLPKQTEVVQPISVRVYRGRMPSRFVGPFALRAEERLRTSCRDRATRHSFRRCPRACRVRLDRHRRSLCERTHSHASSCCRPNNPSGSNPHDAPTGRIYRIGPA